MEKRNITFITGNIATYDLTAESLAVLLDFLPDGVDYGKLSDTVYQVTSLKALEETYNNHLVFPKEGGEVLEIYFFDGDYFDKEMKEEELKMEFKSRKYSYHCICTDIYKRYEL